MKRRLTYSKAVEILTAFLGTDIIVEEVGRGKHKTCKVEASNITKEGKIVGTSIIQRQSWEEVLYDLLPASLSNAGKKIPFEEIGYVSTVYRFRHIGADIKRRSRLALQQDRSEDDETRRGVLESSK